MPVSVYHYDSSHLIPGFFVWCTMYECPRCNSMLSSESYYRNKLTKTGLDLSKCKSCKISYQKEYTNDNLEKVRAYKKQHAQDTKEKRAKYKKQYGQTTKGKAAIYAACAKRRASKQNSTQGLGIPNSRLIRTIYAHCPDGYSVEHMLPLSRGGDHHESNLCYLPQDVNLSKYDKTIIEFGQAQFHSHAIYWQDTI
jgi:transcription elongation factor Elf1